MIYREDNSRYIAIKYSVRGRDLGSTVEEAMAAVAHDRSSCPRAIHLDWTGEYESQKRANARLAVIVPLTVLLIFLVLYVAFRFAEVGRSLILLNVAMAPIGGILALC